MVKWRYPHRESPYTYQARSFLGELMTPPVPRYDEAIYQMYISGHTRHCAIVEIEPPRD